MTAQAQARPIAQANADWFAAKYPDGADCIARWTAAGEIVIVEQKARGYNDGNKN